MNPNPAGVVTMSSRLRTPRLSTIAALLFLSAGRAVAAEAPVDEAVAARKPSTPLAVVPVTDATSPAVAQAQDDVTRELIDILAAKGLLNETEATRLVGKLREQAAKRVAAKSVPAAGSAAAASAEEIAAAAAAAAPGGADAPKRGTVRGVYLPEAEKQRIREEIKAEVLETAKAENWAQPNTLPAWTRRITIGGDLRLRFERDLFDSNNSPFFIDFNTLNAGNAYDVSQNNVNLPPLLNTQRDRAVPRFRARLDIKAAVNDDLDAVFRLASGNARNPVSTNQTLGTTFNRTTLTLDTAYIEWRALPGLNLRGGRGPNPWLSTDLVWDEDLNFDGITARYDYRLGAVTPFITVGAYSVQNTDLDFPSAQAQKVASRDKYLYGAQLGSRIDFSDSSKAEFGVAYYYFDKLNGELSSPCLALTDLDACDSDLTRPGFSQGGNTQFALRNLLVDPANPDGPQFQYFGLASSFRELAFTTRFDAVYGGGIHSVLSGEYVYNLGYRQGRVAALSPVNNFDDNGVYSGGRAAYGVNLLVGYPDASELGQWSISGSYRRLESDAVVDAFTDSDFRLGGTNAKGYTIGGRLGVGHNIWLQTRWLSATEVTGAPLAIDVLQLDFEARF